MSCFKNIAQINKNTYFCNEIKIVQMKDYLNKLHQLKLFRLEEVSDMTGNVGAAKALLASYVERGFVCHIRTDLYSVTNLATKTCASNKYEIASHISNSSFISYHAAMEYHGFGHQISQKVMVGCKSRFRPFEYDGISYSPHVSTINDGIITPPMDSNVRVTDRERTVIDCIDYIKYAGGLEELVHSLSSITFLNEKKLVEYLALYGKPTLYKKVGFFLSRFQEEMQLSQNFISHCKDHAGEGVVKLTDQAKQYDSEWMIYMPQNILSYLEQGVEEYV